MGASPRLVRVRDVVVEATWVDDAISESAMQKHSTVIEARTKPDKSVLLDCEGRPSCGLWAAHDFARRENRNRCIDIIYSCRGCGHERKFGCEALHGDSNK